MELVKYHEDLVFIKTQDIVSDCYRLLSHINDCYFIVGIARSGLMPASILSVLTNSPLYSVELKNGIITNLKSGIRTSSMFDRCETNNTIYIVDDSSYTGRALSSAERVIRHHYPDKQIKKLVLYSTYSAFESGIVDYTSRVLNTHMFEWNMFSSPMTPCLMTDMDGVLCRDFLHYEDDDSTKYIHAMKNMKLGNVRPQSRYPITIVTARLEKYREITEEWLKTNKVNYDKLIMGPWNNISERHNSNVAEWKASVYNSYPSKMIFIESDIHLALDIFKYTKRPTLHYESGKVFQ